MSDHEHVWGVTSGGQIVGVKAICVAGDCNEMLDAIQIGRRLNAPQIADAALKRAAKEWLDCATYDEDLDMWTVTEKNDEYHKLFALVADKQEPKK